MLINLKSFISTKNKEKILSFKTIATNKFSAEISIYLIEAAKTENNLQPEI